MRLAVRILNIRTGLFMTETQAMERMRQVIQRQHKALSTKAIDLHWLSHYMVVLKRMPPALTSEQLTNRNLL
jgi:hypothetical protein